MRKIKLLDEKDNMEIAERLYELSKDMDYMDYEENKEKEIKDICDYLHHLKDIAQNEYNGNYFRTFWNILQRI